MRIFQYLLCIVLSLLTANSFASPSAWLDRSSKTIRLKAILTAPRILQLNDAVLKQQLENAPHEVSASQQARQASQQITLPLPDGSNENVTIVYSPIAEQGLIDKYPQLKTWKVHGASGQIISGRVDFTSSGFRAMLSLKNGETLYIDPEEIDGEVLYLSYIKLHGHQHGFQCLFNHETSFRKDLQLRSQLLAKTTSSLKTYRLAVATTAEYTNYHGGTVKKGLEAVVTTINRVNQIYERDLSTRLLLVAQNDQIIYTNSSTDPYSNSSVLQMIYQNQFTLDSVIGSNNYDIGHVFGTGGGGIAEFEAACKTKKKAFGATGKSSPEGDTFDIEYVAHELGHQLGAEHTFNSTKDSCSTRAATTAFEPGSGSTIMAYAGICGTDNLQETSDAVFHTASIKQITTFVNQGGGASCAGSLDLSNTAPEASADSDHTIPANTPFVLKGSANDADSDDLSYAWDQMDAGTASAVDVDKGDNAIIRSYLPSATPERIIPKLSGLISGKHTTGELLPTTSRELNFKFVVRDGKGGIGTDDIKLTVEDTGSAFKVTEPSTAITVDAGRTLDINWDVANTSAPPISCQKVDIALSIDAGENFKAILNKTANDGSQRITIPSNTSDSQTARISVSCSDNIFFAISPIHLKIKQTTTAETETSTSTVTQKESSSSGTLTVKLLLVLLTLLVIRLYRHQQQKQVKS